MKCITFAVVKLLLLFQVPQEPEAARGRHRGHDTVHSNTGTVPPPAQAAANDAADASRPGVLLQAGVRLPAEEDRQEPQLIVLPPLEAWSRVKTIKISDCSCPFVVCFY